MRYRVLRVSCVPFVIEHPILRYCRGNDLVYSCQLSIQLSKRTGYGEEGEGHARLTETITETFLYDSMCVPAWYA